ncbi:MAG TPA: NfeD family protein [Methylomirabilota bacterium]|nr:NfeD family protein [Methylomirabilota bacterium]
MGNWVNWLLVIVGIVCVIVELALGALTGFDLALVGGSLTVGGIIGLFTDSAKIGLLSGGVLSFIYLAIFRRWLRAKLTVKDQPTNADALLGKTGVVTQKIGAAEAGLVKVGSEIWRAELAQASDGARDVGATVKVEAVEGVTIKVR